MSPSETVTPMALERNIQTFVRSRRNHDEEAR